MSLLDNNSKKGLTMLSAFFLLFACEEPSELPLGISPKQGHISSHVVEIPIETFQLRKDNIPSSLTKSNPYTYIGKISDPEFGTTKATAHTNIGAPDPKEILILEDNVTAKSAVLHLKFSNNFIGKDISAPQTIKVYHIVDNVKPEDNKIKRTNDSTIKKDSKIDSLEYFYTISNTVPLEKGRLIGQTTFDTASVENNIVKIELSDEFAQEIVTELKNNPATFHNQQAFDDFIGSIAIEAGEENTFITNYDFTNENSKISLTINNASSSVISFPFTPITKTDNIYYRQFPTYFSLETDFSGTALEGIEDNPKDVPFQTSDNQLYFQSGVGLLPKISFSALEEFVTSTDLSNVIINSAVLEIDSIKPRTVKNFPTAPAALSFYLVEDENNKRFPGVSNERYAGAQLVAQSYITTENDTLIRYRADIAEEVEVFFREKESKYLQGMLYNSNSSSPTSLSSFVADPQHIVLKIYYTTLEEKK